MMISSKGTTDFADLLEDLLVEEHQVPRHEAASLVASHPGIVVPAIMQGHLMLRPAAIRLLEFRGVGCGCVRGTVE